MGRAPLRTARSPVYVAAGSAVEVAVVVPGSKEVATLDLVASTLTEQSFAAAAGTLYGTFARA